MDTSGDQEVKVFLPFPRETTGAQFPCFGPSWMTSAAQTVDDNDLILCCGACFLYVRAVSHFQKFVVSTFDFFALVSVFREFLFTPIKLIRFEYAQERGALRQVSRLRWGIDHARVRPVRGQLLPSHSVALCFVLNAPRVLSALLRNQRTRSSIVKRDEELPVAAHLLLVY